MKTSKIPSPINPSFCCRFVRLIPAVALSFALFAGAVNSHATTYFWTNTTGAAWGDPGAWNPVGGPGGNTDTANFQANGVYDVPLLSNFVNNSSILFGATGAGQSLQVTLDFGTNIFAGISGNSSSASGFVFGNQQGSTAIVYIAVGTMYCTNANNTPSNARLIVGRNGPAYVYLTNGTAVVGNTVIANGANANGSKLVISGPNSFWTNQTDVSLGNNSSTVSNSLVISNSASLTCLGTFEAGWEGSSSFNSVLVDSSASLFTRIRTAIIGTGAASSNNTMTVQNGALWDNGGQAITVGNTSGFNNLLTVGSNSVVSNATTVTVITGNGLSLAGGLLRTSIGVTNSSGTISGFGTIVGNVVFTGAGTLSLGSGITVGTLTLSNNLTLVSGSTTILKLDNSQTGSNDQINIAGTLTEAGTLMVITNGAAPLNIGDQYQLFVGTQAGAFSTINLPPLDPSKLWNTNQLASAGILGVTFMPVVPGMVGPTGQVVTIGSTVVISAVVTGVPTPGVYWQFNGVNTTDGPQADGSTNSGSATATLTISNAQTSSDGTTRCR